MRTRLSETTAPKCRHAPQPVRLAEVHRVGVQPRGNFPLDQVEPSDVLKGGDQVTSGKYAKDYNEVKALGSLVNSDRTPEHTDVAYFFSDNSILLWTRVLRSMTGTYISNIGHSARL